MTDPNVPDPAAQPAQPAQPVAPAAPAAPAAQPAYAAPAAANAGTYPGKGLGIAALIVALVGLFVWFIAPLAGLIMGAVARSQSKKAGFKNGAATGAIIVGIILLVLHLIAVIAFGGLFAAIIANCPQDAYGTYVCS